MSEENFEIGVLPFGRLAEMVKSVSHLARLNRECYRSVYFAAKDGALRLFATDGISAAWITHPVEAGDCESIAVNNAELETAVASFGKDAAKQNVFLSRVGKELVLESYGLAQRRASIADGLKYESLTAHKSAAASAHLHIKDAVKILTALRKNHKTVALHFQRGDDAAAAWMDVKIKTVITEASFKSHATWSPALTLSCASAGPALGNDCSSLRLYLPTDFLIAALKHSGKEAVVRLFLSHPTGYGGVSVTGDNECTHLISPVKEKAV